LFLFKNYRDFARVFPIINLNRNERLNLELQLKLTETEKETFELALEKGMNAFEALRAAGSTLPENYRILADYYGYKFLPEVPQGALKVEVDGFVFYTDSGAVYTHNPFKIPAEYAIDREIVIVPPLRKAEAVEDSEEDFWVSLIRSAVINGWGDIHYEPSESIYRIRIRNDLGKIETYRKVEKEQGEKLLRRFLNLAGVPTSMLHVPQDGRISFGDIKSDEPSKKSLREFLEKIKDTPCDMRISVIPTNKGPSAVIRILPRNRTISTDLASLGYSPEAIKKLSGYPKLSKGLILVVGPTGSGKSTLIWAMEKLADPEKRKIVSIEDPIEAEVPGVQQVEVKLPVYDKDGKLIGVDFATAIRAFMRQNPDVIVVGEIRDEETARTAIQASNTGHLVISTLHANDEIEAVKRLLDLAQEKDIAKVVNQIRLIVAQRLVPVVCPECREMGFFPKVEVNDFFLSRVPVEIRKLLEERVKGQEVLSSAVRETCGKCRGGFAGRRPVVGILEMTRELRDFVVRKEGIFETDEFMKIARDNSGYRSYVEDAVEKLRANEITIEDFIEIL